MINRVHKAFSFLFTAILGFIYPFIYLSMADIITPPLPGELRCGMPQAAFAMACWFLFLPCSLIIQWCSNQIFIRD
jgi:hypothetical protein